MLQALFTNLVSVSEIFLFWFVKVNRFCYGFCPKISCRSPSLWEIYFNTRAMRLSYWYRIRFNSMAGCIFPMQWDFLGRVLFKILGCAGSIYFTSKFCVVYLPIFTISTYFCTAVQWCHERPKVRCSSWFENAFLSTEHKNNTALSLIVYTTWELTQ